MTWQRGARLALAAVGLACAAGIYFLARPRPELPPALTPIVVDEQALEQGGRGTNIRLRADRTRIFTVEYERFASYNDGRTVFFNAQLRTEEEPRIDVRADIIEVKGRPGQNTEQGTAELQGHVRVLTGDGLELLTERARFEDETQRVTIQGPLTYTQGRISGEGVDGTYDRREKVLSIADGARATVAPGGEGETETQASSKSMTLVRPARQLRLETGAEIVRRAERLSGDRATLFMSEDEQHVQRVELRGQAHVTPTGAPGVASPPEMRGDTIDLRLHDGGQTLRQAVLVSETGDSSMVVKDASGLTSVSAPLLNAELGPDGTTLMRLEGRGRAQGPTPGRVVVNLPAAATSPAREVVGDRLLAQGGRGTGLENARFSGSVRYVERAEGSREKPREATADVLVLSLDGKLSAVTTADFQGHARFNDGPTSASADRAVYGAADKTLELRQSPGGGPRPQAETTRASVGAQEIDLWLESQDLTARGDVVASIRPEAGGSKSAGVFDGRKPLTGRAQTLTYRGSQAVFQGTSESLAIVTQDDSEVRAEVVALTTDTNSLDATGHVTSKFSLASTPATPSGSGGSASPAGSASESYTVTGHKLTYDDATRTLVMVRTETTQAKLTTGQGIVEADRIVFTLESASRALKSFLATGSVYAVLNEEDAGRARGGAPRQRRAVADSLEFVAATKRYVLAGQPSATIVLPATEDGNCRRVDGARLEFQLDREELAGDSSSLPVPCTIRLR